MGHGPDPCQLLPLEPRHAQAEGLLQEPCCRHLGLTPLLLVGSCWGELLALQWQLLQQLVLLVWHWLGQTEGLYWILGPVEVRMSPAPDCYADALGPALSPVVSMRQLGQELAGVAGGYGTAAVVAGVQHVGVLREGGGTGLGHVAVQALVGCSAGLQYWYQTEWLEHATVGPAGLGRVQMVLLVLADRQVARW